MAGRPGRCRPLASSGDPAGRLPVPGLAVPRAGRSRRGLPALDEGLGRVVALKTIQARSAPLSAKVPPIQEGVGDHRATGTPRRRPVHAPGHCGDGRPYYVMRFIDGETLNDSLRRFHSQYASGTDPAGCDRISRPAQPVRAGLQHHCVRPRSRDTTPRYQALQRDARAAR